MKTPDSRLPFGKHRGMTLRQCPVDYLEWMSRKLADSDLHAWAAAARQALEERSANERKLGNLEAEADAILKRAGVNPRKP